ncbi:MAG: TRAP transporter small permease [Desulfobacteraceae bacterium]|jgi:TRAP-type C4-dicarboxylate transport system permease small subunit
MRLINISIDVPHSVSDFLNRICELALVILLAAMAVVVFLQVLFRYVLHLPLFWTEEFARYCLVWASLLGAAVALKRGEHIAVTFFLDTFPKRAARALTLFAQVSVVLILVVMVWGGIKLVLVTRAQISPALRISMAIPYLALPVGAVIMLFHMASSMMQRQGRTSVEDAAGP